jgi:hypothetical protein
VTTTCHAAPQGADRRLPGPVEEPHAFIIDAARAYATEGEIRNAMRVHFGDYHEPAEF